jgi:cytidylate kinase
MTTIEHKYQTEYRNIFEKYFSESLKEETSKPVETGPYISISRDFGCMANVIAQKLSVTLTRINKSKGVEKEWQWLNKSLLQESAKALELSPLKIEYVFHSKRKTMMEEVVSAMATRYYKSDRKIRKTITDVIRSIAVTGNVIIVGRGGVAFKNDNPQSLHIKLVAPIEWRVEKISQNYHKSKGEALRRILEIDHERKYLIDSFMGYTTDETLFDVVFNRSTMDDDMIISSMLSVMEKKHLI